MSGQAVVLTAIIVVFVVFAATLFWGDISTNRRNR